MRRGMRQFAFVGALLAAVVAFSGIGWPRVASAQAPGCATSAVGPCWESPELLVVPKAVRQSAQGYNHFVSVTLQFVNRTGRAIVLGYTARGTLATDDRGNRFRLHGKITGLPHLAGSATPLDFVLEPGGSREATLEYAHRGNVQIGSVFDIVLAARELRPTSNGRSQPGTEQPVSLRGLTIGEAATGVATPGEEPVTPPAEPATPRAEPVTPPPAVATPTSPCSDVPDCLVDGNLVAQLLKISTQRTGEKDDEQHAAVFLKLTNRGDSPLVLAYRLGDAQLVDSNGNAFLRHSRDDADLVFVMGVLGAPGKAGSLVIEPGASRNVVFRHLLEKASRLRLGTEYDYDVGLVELDRAGGEVRRDYALRFRKVSAQVLAPQEKKSEFDEFREREGRKFRRSQ